MTEQTYEKVPMYDKLGYIKYLEANNLNKESQFKSKLEFLKKLNEQSLDERIRCVIGDEAERE